MGSKTFRVFFKYQEASEEEISWISGALAKCDMLPLSIE